MTKLLLLQERDRLLRQLTRLETRRALGVRPSRQAPRARRPSSRCVLAYVDACLHALPDLAWNDSVRGSRERLLRELHDAYANEDLELLRALRSHAVDEPPTRLPEPAVRRRLRLHVAWLADRVGALRATRSP